MGKRHRKDRRRERLAGARSRQSTDHGQFTDDDLRAALRVAAGLAGRVEQRTRSGALRVLWSAEPHPVAAVVERELLAAVDELWNRGWQPAEVVRQARRRGTAPQAEVGAATIAADDVGRDPASLHPRWAEQVMALTLPAVAGTSGWLLPREPELWPHRLGAAIGFLTITGQLGPLEVLLPPPGSQAPGSRSPLDWQVRSPGGAEPMLERVRALLAKAESTPYEAEAGAFTAKAQELMARHSIDAAVLWDRSERGEEPIAVRLPVDEPYVDAKCLLLQVVADHFRCRSAHYGPYALSSVVGFADDLAATEVLFTSLLVQAQTALRAAAAATPPGSRERSRGFKASFLLAYAQRIDERLAEVDSAVVQTAEAEHTGSVLPALVARSAVVDEAFDARFGELRTTTMRSRDPLGGWLGRAAADDARLNAGDLTGSTP